MQLSTVASIALDFKTREGNEILDPVDEIISLS